MTELPGSKRCLKYISCIIKLIDNHTQTLIKSNTELKKSQKEAEKDSPEKREFLSNVSTNFKLRCNGLLGYAQLLKPLNNAYPKQKYKLTLFITEANTYGA